MFHIKKPSNNIDYSTNDPVEHNEYNALWNQLNAIQSLPEYKPRDPIILDRATCRGVMEKWRNRIDQIAKRLAKQALANVDILEGTSIYENLDNPSYRKAASVTEIFRHTDLTGNSGRLDVKTLQKLIVTSYENSQNGSLTFELGWGQAKRDAGLLKNPGPYVDLGEVISIARLGIILKATQHIYDSDAVSLRIITGGSRFYQALFTRPELDAAYNAQRASVATALGFHNIILFDTIERYHSQQQISERLETTVHKTTAPHKSHLFRFVLFNIDWYHILGAGNNPVFQKPHGMEAPPEFLEWFGELPGDQQQLLLRELLACLANSHIDVNPPSQLIKNTALLEDARQWMSKVAVLSADKYDAIGKLTPRDEHFTSHSPVILTVIDKPLKPFIPSLLLVGRHAGYTVPQHVVPIVQPTGNTNFLPYFHVVNNYRPVFVEEDSEGSLQWCRLDGQPLCFLNDDSEASLRAIAQLIFIDGM